MPASAPVVHIVPQWGQPMTRDDEALREYMDDEDDKDFMAEGHEAELETGFRRRQGPEGYESAAELRRRAQQDNSQRVILSAPQRAAEQGRGKSLATFEHAPRRPLLWDSCSTAHIVTSASLLDDYVVSCPPTFVNWGNEGFVLESVGYGTLVTKNHLPEGNSVITTFKRVLHVPDFGVCILSVKHVASKASGGAVYFKEGSHFFEGRLIGWGPEPAQYGDLYELKCDVLSGTTRDTVLVATSTAVSEARRKEVLYLHACLAHVSGKSVQRVHQGITDEEVAAIR